MAWIAGPQCAGLLPRCNGPGGRDSLAAKASLKEQNGCAKPSVVEQLAAAAASFVPSASANLDEPPILPLQFLPSSSGPVLVLRLAWSLSMLATLPVLFLCPLCSLQQE